MEPGFTKIFESLLDSTLWQGSKELKLVWVTMLLMKNKLHIVEASVPGLAKRAGVTVPECEQALRDLMSPDPYSRTKEFEGRRIEVVDGGWKVLNGELYKLRMGPEWRKEYMREYMAMKRALERANKLLLSSGKPLPGEAAYVKSEQMGGSNAQLDAIVTAGLGVQMNQEQEKLRKEKERLAQGENEPGDNANTRWP